MKIDITSHTITAIADAIAASATKIIERKLGELEEAALIAEIRALPIADYDKILKYLMESNRHQQGGWRACVSNSFLAKAFGLHVLAMKRVREGLVEKNGAWVRRQDNRLAIYLPQPYYGPANDGGQNAAGNPQ